MQVHHGQQAENVTTHQEHQKHFRRPPAHLLSNLLACLLVFFGTYVRNLLSFLFGYSLYFFNDLLTYLPTYLLIYPPTYLLTHLLADLLAYVLAYSLTTCLFTDTRNDTLS